MVDFDRDRLVEELAVDVQEAVHVVDVEGHGDGRVVHEVRAALRDGTVTVVVVVLEFEVVVLHADEQGEFVVVGDDEGDPVGAGLLDLAEGQLDGVLVAVGDVLHLVREVVRRGVDVVGLVGPVVVAVEGDFKVIAVAGDVAPHGGVLVLPGAGVVRAVVEDLQAVRHVAVLRAGCGSRIAALAAARRVLRDDCRGFVSVGRVGVDRRDLFRGERAGEERHFVEVRLQRAVCVISGAVLTHREDDRVEVAVTVFRDAVGLENLNAVDVERKGPGFTVDRDRHVVPVALFALQNGILVGILEVEAGTGVAVDFPVAVTGRDEPAGVAAGVPVLVAEEDLVAGVLVDLDPGGQRPRARSEFHVVREDVVVRAVGGDALAELAVHGGNVAFRLEAVLAHVVLDAVLKRQIKLRRFEDVRAGIRGLCGDHGGCADQSGQAERRDDSLHKSHAVSPFQRGKMFVFMAGGVPPGGTDCARRGY